jgi:hypothetical protein
MRETGGEEKRFTEAFARLLERDPNTAPGPTALNRELGKTGQRTPLNVLNGRMSVLRRRLLEEAGFVQDEKWKRWHRP